MKVERYCGALLGGLLLLATAEPLCAGDVPGLVKEKPTEGQFVETPQGFMVPYTETIPGTEITFEMVPVPGGKVRVGSPEGEEGREANEGPQFEVEVEPYWMGKYEVTWSEYWQFMALYEAFKDFDTLRTTLTKGANDTPDLARRREALTKLLEQPQYKVLQQRLVKELDAADAITAPTKLYEPSFTYEFGEEPRQPAVTMTQYAAKHYTKWLSALTGEYYRLPSEAEWEHACRAGSTTAYSFGDDPSALDDYAWHADNSDYTIHLVGEKKPNAWGLYDMHGNAAEWVLDELREDGYQQFAGKSLKAADAVAWPTQADQRVVKGGHWDSTPEACRVAARLGSNDSDWKSYDPNIPLSPWWFTSDPGRGVSFRLLRPLGAPTEAFKKKAWEEDTEPVLDDVANRLEEGRGAEAAVDQQLPDAIKQLNEVKQQINK